MMLRRAIPGRNHSNNSTSSGGGEDHHGHRATDDNSSTGHTTTSASTTEALRRYPPTPEKGRMGGMTGRFRRKNNNINNTTATSTQVSDSAFLATTTATGGTVFHPQQQQHQNHYDNNNYYTNTSKNSRSSSHSSTTHIVSAESSNSHNSNVVYMIPPPTMLRSSSFQQQQQQQGFYPMTMNPPPLQQQAPFLRNSSSGFYQPPNYLPALPPSSSSSTGAGAIVVAPPPLPPVPRRKSRPTLSLYQTTSITKHYDMNAQILQAFEFCLNNHWYQVAYAVGMQFVETALLEIPKHGYYYSTRHEQERMQSSIEAVRVTELLQELLDKETQELAITSSPAEETRLNKLRDLAVQQVNQASEDQYERHRAKTEQELLQEWELANPVPTTPAVQQQQRRQHQQQQQQHYVDADWVFCGGDRRTSAASLMSSCHQAAVDFSSHVLCPGSSARSVPVEPAAVPLVLAQQQQHHHPFELSNTGPTQLIERQSSSAYSGTSVQAAIAPELHRTQSSPDDLLLEKALYLSGLEVLSPAAAVVTALEDREQPPALIPSLPSSSDASIETATVDLVSQQQQEQQPVSSSKASLELETLSAFYHEDFDSFVREGGLIRISFAPTYQGRLPASTNGCTVISPLLCIHHLLSDDATHVDDSVLQAGLSDADICYIIDCETPAILSELRQQLGLSQQAFLIPSDAHDYFIANGQLSQQQFVTCLGGNILNEEHVQAFIDALVNQEDDDKCTKFRRKHRKLAGTLFFHEHVVAILKIRRPPNPSVLSGQPDNQNEDYWYDLIDSLPLKRTLARPGESDKAFCRRMGLEATPDEMDETYLCKTARMRCCSVHALRACIRWYACSKFSDENRQYIDNYAWDDMQSDFDPRVFQAFVWGDAQ